MSSWVTTLIYAKAGHLSIIGLWFSTRTFIFITGGGMCMWRQRYPKSTGKAESKAVRQFNMRGYGDQEDDALLSCACPKGESTLQTTARGLPLLTLPAFVRLTRPLHLKVLAPFMSLPQESEGFCLTTEVWAHLSSQSCQALYYPFIHLDLWTVLPFCLFRDLHTLQSHQQISWTVSDCLCF